MEMHVSDGDSLPPARAHGFLGGSFGFTSGPNSRMAPVDRENKLFVGMLPHDADDMTLTAVFSRFGEITEVCVFLLKVSRRWRLSCPEYRISTR